MRLESFFFDTIKHHGIKGQKWGVRRFQNSDGTLTEQGRKRYAKEINKAAKKAVSRVEVGLTEERTIPAGIKMYRVTPGKEDTNPNESTYVTYTNVDRDHYKSGWTKTIDDTKKSYEHQYTLTEDLKIPSRQTQYEVINKVINSNKKYLNESVTSFIDQTWPALKAIDPAKYNISAYKKATNAMINKWKNETPEEIAFQVCQTLGVATNVKKEIIKELSKMGYNAMADEASIAGQNRWPRAGYDPLIIFDKNILNENKVKSVGLMSEGISLAKYDEWFEKAWDKNAAWSAEGDSDTYKG